MFAYNDCIWILLKKLSWCSPSNLFCNAGVSTFQALLRNLMYKSICRLNDSQDAIIMRLANPGFSVVQNQSPLWKHWTIFI